MYHIVSRFASPISTLKLGAIVSNSSFGLGELIFIVGTVTSFLMVTSANSNLPKVSFA
ncbi:MAG: hypothetical protein ACTSRT_14685 [Promethearchaeota archaeon]